MCRKRLQINQRFKKLFKAIKRFKIVRNKETVKEIIHKKCRHQAKLDRFENTTLARRKNR